MNTFMMTVLAMTISGIANADDYATHDEPYQELEMMYLDCSGFNTPTQLTHMQFTDCAIQYEVGDTGPAGGTVFYIVAGSNGTHGMESSPEETELHSWGCLKQHIEGAGNKGVGEGKSNFYAIIAKGCSPIANAVQEHSVNGFDDWYLGSRNEVELMLNVIPAPQYQYRRMYYWTSSQHDDRISKVWIDGGAYLVQFFYPDIVLHTSQAVSYKTRPIRNF